MLNIIKSSLYKLVRDITFKATLIVCVVLAIILALANFALAKIIGQQEAGYLCSGAVALFSNATPSGNFGLAVPINLVILIVGEYSYGTIRNKIIAGYKKSTIYFGLLITGLIFAFLLMFIYLSLTVGLYTAFGKGVFDPTGGNITGLIVFKFILVVIFTYLFVVSLTVFIATNIRAVGGSIALVILALVLLTTLSTIIEQTPRISEMNKNIIAWFDPLYMIGSCSGILSMGGINIPLNDPLRMAAGIVSPLVYSVIFIALGTFIFSKRDIK